MSERIWGYLGKLLRVDLTEGEIKEEELDREMAEKYVGGAGLGSSILKEEISDNIDALDPENKLIFFSGPFSGTGIPGSGTYSVVTKGPLTDLAVGAQANGWFGARMKFAGYDGIIVEGKAAELSYLVIDDENVSIKKDPELEGKGTNETQQYLLDKFDLSKGSVACIGPAGENEVLFANIASDFGHFASTNGVGAVMGSKNLKAIVVSGNEKVPIYDEDKFKDIVKEWQKNVKETMMGATVDQLGTNGFFSAAAETGWLPVKNMTTNIFEKHAEFNGDVLREKVESKRTPCHACPLHHCNKIVLKDEPHKGLETDEPEYEGMAAFGPLIGNDERNEAIYLNDYNDKLGMDLKECGYTISNAIECFEDDLIDKEDTDGLELTWGNVEAVEELLTKIANKEGFGKTLSQGVYRASQEFGEEAVEKAVFTHSGIAPHIHDPRGLWGYLYGQVISNMGSIEGFGSSELIPQPDIGFEEPIEKYKDSMELVNTQDEMAKKYYFVDSLGICFFTSVDVPMMVEALNALTGFNYSDEDALKQGQRAMTALKLFNISQGWTREDDQASERLLEPNPDGPNEGISIRGELDDMISAHYENMGWDEKGHPKDETLEMLDIK